MRHTLPTLHSSRDRLPHVLPPVTSLRLPLVASLCLPLAATLCLPLVASLCLAFGLPASAMAQAEGAPILTASPQTLTLDGAASPVDLMIQGSAEITRFEVDLQYEPSVVVLTAVEPGDWLKGTGGTVTPLAPTAKGNGLVTVGVTVEYPKDQAPQPPGAGSLLRVTFAPLAVGAATISFANANLTDRNGQALTATVMPVQAQVVSPPPPDVQTAALAQTKALTATASTGGGFQAPNLDSLTGGLTDWLKGTAWTGIWIAVLCLALLTVGLGWYFGRRPLP